MQKLFNSKYGKPIFQSTITVPGDYVFEKHIDTFIKDAGSSIRMFGDSLNDENYSRVSNQLKPGETYQVEIVPIVEYIANCQQCLNDLKEEKGLIFFGAQGLVLFKQKHPTELPKGYLFSFDQKENLFHNGNTEELPYMYYSEFSSINFWSSLSSRGQYLLLFYKI